MILLGGGDGVLGPLAWRSLREARAGQYSILMFTYSKNDSHVIPVREATPSGFHFSFCNLRRSKTDGRED